MLIDWIKRAIEKAGGNQTKLASMMTDAGTPFAKMQVSRVAAGDGRKLLATEMLAMAAVAELPLPVSDENGNPIPLLREDELPAQFAKLLASENEALKREVAEFIAFRFNAIEGADCAEEDAGGNQGKSRRDLTVEEDLALRLARERAILERQEGQKKGASRRAKSSDGKSNSKPKSPPFVAKDRS